MDECISTEFRCRVRSGLKCEHAGFWSGSRMRSAGELCGTFSHFINLRKNCKRGERKGKHTPWCDGWDGIEGQTKGRCFETPLTTRCIFYMDWLNCNNMFWWMLWRLQGICFLYRLILASLTYVLPRPFFAVLSSVDRIPNFRCKDMPGRLQ